MKKGDYFFYNTVKSIFLKRIFTKNVNLNFSTLITPLRKGKKKRKKEIEAVKKFLFKKLLIAIFFVSVIKVLVCPLKPSDSKTYNLLFYNKWSRFLKLCERFFFLCLDFHLNSFTCFISLKIFHQTALKLSDNYKLIIKKLF